jgi:4-hydroxybenzoate polyprenyltransferase
MLTALIESLRPKQWIKNLAIFAAIIFSQNLHNLGMLVKVCLACLIFCLLSGSIYLINDVLDMDNDRQHPLKCKRPIPSGRLSPKLAITTSVGLTILCLAGSFWLQPQFGFIALSYFVLLAGYSLKLKQIVIVDVMVIALGFVLRVVSGALVIRVEISSWLLICTILLALFLALSKRRHELMLLDKQAVEHRQILREYSPYFLDQMIAVVTASTLMAYALYTMSAETIAKFNTPNLPLTIPFVLYGIFRYLYLVHQRGQGGSPTNIMFTDLPLIVNTLLWLVSVEIILYMARG